MMEFLTEYDVVNDKTNTSSVFNVKHKLTGKMYRFQSILCASLSENEQKALMNKIKTRISLSHPNVLRFYDHIQHKDVIYLRQEYCEHSTLASFIQKECVNKDRQLHEMLICRMLYQTVFALKTIDCFMGLLSLDNIMLNDEYNIKLYNFFNGGNKGQKQKEIKMSQLGAIIFELCTLEIFEKSSFELKLSDQCYTNEFKHLLTSMIKDNAEIKKHINKILCHPTVLLQSSQWSKESCFTEKRQEPIKTSASTEPSEKPVEDYPERLEKLRRREAALEVKEQLLKEQERKLAHREKKIQTMERTVKEKLQQAELYLKRCREGGRSMSSESSKSSNRSQSSSQSKKMSYEDLDPNYVSCGDSDVFPTSAKLQVDKIIKPQNFSRTLSERRIRFKTSPLKDNNFIRKKEARKSWRHSKIIEEHFDLPKIQPEEIKDVRRKPLFLSNNEYENDLTTMPREMNNIVWTEESKKYAFEMLRLMNNEEKENVDVKHTHL